MSARKHRCKAQLRQGYMRVLRPYAHDLADLALVDELQRAMYAEADVAKSSSAPSNAISHLHCNPLRNGVPPAVAAPTAKTFVGAGFRSVHAVSEVRAMSTATEVRAPSVLAGLSDVLLLGWVSELEFAVAAQGDVD